MGHKNKALVWNRLAKRILCFYVTISIVLASFTIFFVEDVKADGTDLYVWGGALLFGAGTKDNPYKYIQDAIDNSTNQGQNIYVWNATYYETIELNKSVNLIGNSSSGVILDGISFPNSDGIHITVNNTSVQNFTITNFTGSTDYYGIYIYAPNWNLNYSEIIGNHIYNNAHGICLKNSNKNNITANQINDSTASTSHGIDIIDSEYNNLTENQIYNNDYGIYFSGSSNNTITNSNQIYNSFYGIYFSGSSNNTITNSNQIYNNIPGIYLIYSNNNNITNNIINDNQNDGIYLYKSEYTNITGNHIYNNDENGTHLFFSNYSEIISNQIYNNKYGIYLLTNSHDNLIYDNNFSNSQNAYDNVGKNFWNKTSSITETNIVGGELKWGNYWSNYIGNDATHDGIGEQDYNNSFEILNGNDTHPLVISPNVTDHFPLDSAENVSVSLGIIVNFSKSMNNVTTEENFSLIQESDSYPIYVSFEWALNNQRMYANVTTPLNYSTVYNATVHWNATDEQGNVMIENYSWNFITEPNYAPYQTGESPTNHSTGISPAPSLSVTCRDNNTGTTMTATWWSNSSGSWVQFATNNLITNNSSITQTNSNFSAYSTKYYWSVNLTDGTDWNNQTYSFTTRAYTSGGTSSQNVAPTARAGDDKTGFINEPIEFDGSGSSDFDGQIVSYFWEFGDGLNATGRITTHTYLSAGTYNVTLTVTDDGGLSDTDTAIIKIYNTTTTDSPPEILYFYHSPSEVTSDDNVTIFAKVIDDRETPSVTVHWSPDGSKVMTSSDSLYSADIGKFSENTKVKYWIEATDTINNPVNSTNKSFTVVIKREIDNVKGEEEQEIDIGSGTINRIKFKTTTDYEKVTTAVEYLTEEEIALMTYNVTGIVVYQYLNMTITANDTYVTEFEYLIINFTVNKTWFKDYNISSINLSRFHNNNWTDFNANTTGENGIDYYYEAEIPGLSTFAVVGSEVVTPEDKHDTVPEIPWLFIIGFIIAAIVILIFILFKAKLIYVEVEEVDVPKKE